MKKLDRSRLTLTGPELQVPKGCCLIEMAKSDSLHAVGLTQEETWQNKTHEQVHVAQREAAARDTFSTADG